VPLPARRPLPTLALALIPRAVALNLALGAVVGALKLPVYLDSVGTILVAVLAGPRAGIVTGIVSNSVLGLLVSPALFAFIPVAIVIGWLAGIAGRMGAFGSLAGAIAAGLVIGVAAALSSAVIVIALMGGLTASGTGILTIAIRATLGVSVDNAAKIAAIVTDALDKPLSCVLVYLVLERLPRRLSARFRSARVQSA
jgi:energy-coupling factor transport system substrate-specific component